MPRKNGDGNKKPARRLVQVRIDEPDAQAVEEISNAEVHKTTAETYRMIIKLGIFYYTMKQANISVD